MITTDIDDGVTDLDRTVWRYEAMGYTTREAQHWAAQEWLTDGLAEYHPVVPVRTVRRPRVVMEVLTHP